MSRTDKDVPYRIRFDRDPKWWVGHRFWYGRYGHGPYGLWGPRREDLHVQWWGPDRAAVRDSLKSAVTEYRAAGEVWSTAPTQQHRHAPARGWWD